MADWCGVRDWNLPALRAYLAGTTSVAGGTGVEERLEDRQELRERGQALQQMREAIP